MRLAVRQFGELAGYLESTADRGVVFRYTAEYTGRSDVLGLSLSLPVQGGEYSQAKCLPFFSGLLPDGETRRRIADYLRVSETSALKLLDALGGECAGTVSLLRDDDQLSEVDRIDARYAEIELPVLAEAILDSRHVPLLAPREGLRLSLAGAQEKLPLFRSDGKWYKPMGGAPSSHIIKPASDAFPKIATNEFFSLRLASLLGLPVPKAELGFIGKPVLIVERFDRLQAADGSVVRLHQEDFCQASGIMPDHKYQTDGGPGFADLARLIRQACALPLADIEHLIDIALFTVLLGNCDAHGKNYSLLYQGNKIAVAPFYDLVATTLWPDLNTKLSMSFGGEYRLGKVGRANVELFARDIGVRPILVADRLGCSRRAFSEIDLPHR